MYPQMSNIFCLIEGGIIYQVDSYNKVPIGYTNDEYNTLAQTTEEYYNKLVEVGVIIPPKTQEQLMEEQQKALLESQKMNQELMKMLQEMRDNNVRADSKQAETGLPTSKARRGNAKGSASDSGEDTQ